MTVRDDAGIIARGLDAWRVQRNRKDKIWEDWFIIGEALKVGREQSLKDAKAHDVYSPIYRKTYGVWLKNNGFSSFPSKMRYEIMRIMERREEIEAYRESLLNSDNPKIKRDRLNDPIYIYEKWQYEMEK